MRLTSVLCAWRRWNPLSVKYANLPETFIKRKMDQVYWKTPPGPQYQRKIVERTKFHFGVDRPWTNEFRTRNMPGVKIRPIHLEPIAEWSFFRGDRVEVLVGRDKGKQGLVKGIIAERNWVYVEGLNTEIVPIGDTEDYSAIMIQKERPLLVTNEIRLVDPSDLQGTSIEWRYTEEGNRVRVSTRTGRIIPIPVADQETVDYKVPSTYKEQPKDTSKRDVEKITFQPALKTFEMDIMETMGIKEDRIPHKTWWY